MRKSFKASRFRFKIEPYTNRFPPGRTPENALLQRQMRSPAAAEFPEQRRRKLCAEGASAGRKREENRFMSKKTFEVRIAPDECKGCERCVIACPRSVLKMGVQ